MCLYYALCGLIGLCEGKVWRLKALKLTFVHLTLEFIKRSSLSV